ncbi:MAG: PCRF domain-containing protein [Myxococcota bacterium]
MHSSPNSSASNACGVIFKPSELHAQIRDLNCALSHLDWNHPPQHTNALLRRHRQLDRLLTLMGDGAQALEDAQVLLDLILQEDDPSALPDVRRLLKDAEATVDELEWRLLLIHPDNDRPAFVCIRAQTHNRDAMDWAHFLLRTLLRFAERRTFKTWVSSLQADQSNPGHTETTVHVEGSFAYGWLRHGAGIHRLLCRYEQPRPTISNAVIMVLADSNEQPVMLQEEAWVFKHVRVSGLCCARRSHRCSLIIRHKSTGLAMMVPSSDHRARVLAMRLLKARLLAQNRVDESLTERVCTLEQGPQHSRASDPTTGWVGDVQVPDGYWEPLLLARLRRSRGWS